MTEEYSVWRKTLELRDWGLVFGLPTTESQFERVYAESEFCGKFEGWHEYKSEIVEPLEKLIIPLVTLGLHFVPHASLNDFTAMLNRRRAIVLFTHCANERVEFREGMVHQSSVVNRVPRSFHGILDMSVCQPEDEFVDDIKHRAPLCFVASTDAILPAARWLYYYGYFLSCFTKPQMSYFAADEKSLRYFATAGS